MQKHSILFILSYLIIRVILFFNYNPEYIGGDAYSYEKMALSRQFTLNEYFKISKEKKEKINNYQFKNIYPYSDLNDVEHWEPGYPIFIKIIYKLKKNRNLIRIIQHAFIILSLLIWWHILKAYCKNKYHFIILFIILLHPFYVAFPQLLYTEVLDTLLISLFYLFYMKNYKTKFHYFAWGLIIGYYTLSETYILPLTIIFIFYYLLKMKSIKNKLILTSSFIIILIPTFYHNYIHTGGGILLSTKNSNNFWMSNNNIKIMNFDMNEIGWPLPKDYYSSPQKYQNIRPPCKVEYKEQTRCEAINAIDFALSEPFNFLKRILIKYTNLWSPNLFPFNYGFNLNALKLKETTSKMIHNSFVFFEIALIVSFFISISYLISIPLDRLTRTILTHFGYFHVIVSFGHGMVRYRLGYMILISVILYITFSKFPTQAPNKKIFIPSLLITGTFVLWVFINKLPLVFL